MVTVGGVVGLAILLAINTVIAALGTRFFRLLLATRLGSIIFGTLFITMALVASTLILSGVFHLGFDLQDTYIATVVAIFIPFAIGATIDLVWVASPAEVEEALDGR